MKKFATAIITLFMIVTMACNTQKRQDETSQQQASKCLVLYYSQTGVTQNVAQHLQQMLGADIEEIKAEVPYDGNFDETIQRCLDEKERGVIASIKPLHSNLADYDVVFLGFPVWFGTYASPISGLVNQYDFAGKKVVTFATFGSGGLESSTTDLRKNLPQAEVVEGYGVREVRKDAVPSELTRFLIENGYLQGEVTPLPDFSAEKPITPGETAIFDAACGNYPFPLGTPVSVAERSIENGTEYRFTVDTSDPQGNKVTGTVYVLAPIDAAPEFTRVIR